MTVPLCFDHRGHRFAGGCWRRLLLFLYSEFHQLLLHTHTHNDYKYSCVVLILSQMQPSAPDLHAIQHSFDHRGNGRHSVLVVKVDTLQHHLIRPANEISQTLIHAVMTGGQR